MPSPRATPAARGRRRSRGSSRRRESAPTSRGRSSSTVSSPSSTPTRSPPADERRPRAARRQLDQARLPLARANLIVELDGGATHHTRHAFERDRARDRKAVVSGYRVVRVTWRQLHEDPTTLAAELRALLEAKYPDARGP